MELKEDELIQNYGKNCGHCSRNTLLPYEYEYTCLSCGYNVINQKTELSKFQRNCINFINRLKLVEHKIFCICIEVYKQYEGDDYDRIYEVLWTLKNKKNENRQYLNWEMWKYGRTSWLWTKLFFKNIKRNI